MEACLAVLEPLRRIQGILAGLNAPMRLTGFLPQVPEMVDDREQIARSAVATTFAAVLELTQTAKLVLGDGERFDEPGAKLSTMMSHDRQATRSS